MSSYEEHCRLCLELLGEEFGYVHKWLDEFHGLEPWRTRHRRLRHHRQGVEEVRRIWGDRAAMAAEIHIRQDLEAEGWPADKPLPDDSDDYRRYGLW